MLVLMVPSLKPEMAPLPAWVSVSLTHVTIVSSFTFCPSPRSSRMFNVYLLISCHSRARVRFDSSVQVLPSDPHNENLA
uniref:Uncharacterized protein n=1 Tax=Anguilla anguilla TaxID=7936 RepID=A0A0E9TZX5_ANGAN